MFLAMPSRMKDWVLIGGKFIWVIGVSETCKHRDIQSFWLLPSALLFLFYFFFMLHGTSWRVLVSVD